MRKLTRKERHVCTGDKRFIYRLPFPATDDLASSLEILGKIHRAKLKQGTIWKLESEQGIEAIFSSDNIEFDARFRRKLFPANLEALEGFLNKYYSLKICQET